MEQQFVSTEETTLSQLGNNQIVSQGFFSEIKTFADMIENKHEANYALGLESVNHVYSLMAEIKKYMNIIDDHIL